MTAAREPGQSRPNPDRARVFCRGCLLIRGITIPAFEESGAEDRTRLASHHAGRAFVPFCTTPSRQCSLLGPRSHPPWATPTTGSHAGTRTNTDDFRWTEPFSETKTKVDTCGWTQDPGLRIAGRATLEVAGEAEVGSAGEQPAKEYLAGDSSDDEVTCGPPAAWWHWARGRPTGGGAQPQ